MLGVLPSCGPAAPVLAVHGGRLERLGPDGAPLEPAALEGTELTIRNHLDRSTRVRIDGERPDPAGLLTMYAVSRLDEATGQWVEMCEPGPDGLRLAIPLPGRWRQSDAAPGDHEDRPPALAFVEDPRDFTLTCTAGSSGKCARLGYLPGWTTTGGESLTPYFVACVRMMRADYCGDGYSYTTPGVDLDHRDRAGRRSRSHTRGMSFEAVWGARGAICVRRPRDRSRVSLTQIAERCPRLAYAVGARCHDDLIATRPDALFVNRSPVVTSDPTSHGEVPHATPATLGPSTR
jgi:hypothetical protein